MKSLAPINENGRRDPRKRLTIEDLTLEELIANKQPGSTYQYKFYEFAASDHELASFIQHEEDLAEREYIRELKERAISIIIDTAKRVLSEKQLHIFTRYYLEGRNQSRISEELGCTQCCIAKTLFGNSDAYKGSKKTYGGVIRKLQKRLKNDVEINNILSNMKDINNDAYSICMETDAQREVLL